MSTPQEHYLKNYLHRSNHEMQMEMSSDWGGAGKPYLEYNPLGYPQEGSSLQWNSTSFSSVSPYSSTSSTSSPSPFSSLQTSAVNGVSLPQGGGYPMNEFTFSDNDPRHAQSYEYEPPTTDVTTAALFKFHLDNPLGVEDLLNQLMIYTCNPNTPPPEISPFSSPCPTSTRCPCMGLNCEELMHLPYIPHYGHKRTRATGPTCRRAIIERFRPEHRGLVIQILMDPDAHAALLANLMAPPDRVGRKGFKHGCLCCPKALRCQSSQKVERHLRGLFNIRPFACQYCGNTSVDMDDNKKHEKKCRLKAHSIVSP